MWADALMITCGILIIIMSWDGIQSSRRLFEKYAIWKGLPYWCFMLVMGIFWVVDTLPKLFCHN